MKNEKELQPYRFRKKETTRGPRKANEKKKKQMRNSQCTSSIRVAVGLMLYQKKAHWSNIES